MIRALYTAATGLQAQQLNTDLIANNLANANTPGFKRDRLNFQDLLYQTFRRAGQSTLTGSMVPNSLRVGHGVRPIATQKLFMTGAAQQTGNPLDIMISGDGFFQVTMADGSAAYTRDGTFKIDGEGNIVTADGLYIEPAINVPADAIRIEISSDGTVAVQIGSDSTLTQIGQIQLVRFQNPAGLETIGQNLYRETDASGDPITGTPGENGFGQTVQGFIEASNVSIVEELIELIVAQRAFEVNSRAVDVADQLLNIANNLAR
ncbi:MAG TPA: flagellar basal-body rod protein FlgG [Firmicutes bacterium]|nr:flagellar basal-body rod protein FlgG [Bacillota bacterium]